MQFSLEAPQNPDDAKQVRLIWKLVNQTGRSWLVLSGDEGCEAIMIRLDSSDGRTSRHFPLVVPGGASRPEFATIAPGETLTRSFDLASFAEVYGGVLHSGNYVVRATYRIAASAYKPEAEAMPLWTGEATAPSLRIRLRP